MRRTDARGTWADRAYARLLKVYPTAFREEYAHEMRAAFRDRLDDTRGGPSISAAIARGAALWTSILADTFLTALGEHRAMLAQDLRFAARTLLQRQNRTFALAAVLTLALGIGAVTAIFSIFHAVLLAPLPYREPDRIVRVAETNLPRGVPEFAVSIPNFLSWQERARSFSGLVALTSTSANVSGNGATPERLSGLRESAGTLDLLGLVPVAGRAFRPEEDVPGGPKVVMIGEGLWCRRYASRPDLIGQAIQIDGEAMTVVGVAPQDLGFDTGIDLWLPLRPDGANESRGDHRLTVLGRLASGVTLPQAESEMSALAAHLAREFPKSNDGWGVRLMTLRDWLVGLDLRTMLQVLLAAVGLLLLVACANIANLQIARATSRLREIGIRLALGASRARVVRQMMTESAALAAAGGLLGVGLAWLAIRGAASVLPASLPRVESISLNASVALVAVGITALTAVVFGLLPALLAAGSDVAVALQRAGRSNVDARRMPIRQGLVALQLALTTLLVIGAALLAQSVARLQAVPLGFQPDRLLIARLSLPGVSEENHARSVAFYDRLVEEVGALPGVRSVGLASEIPMGPLNTSMPVGPIPRGDGVPEEGVQASWRIITNEYLRTLGVPVVRGRLFDAAHDPKNPLVISEGLARRLWPGGEDPIGRRTWMGNGNVFTVIGVVGDVRQIDLASDPSPAMYFPTTYFLWPTMTLVVRAEGDPAALTNAVRQATLRVSKDQPLFDVQTMRTVIASSAAAPRVNTLLLSTFAGLTLLLAAVGVAGLVAYIVARRTPEIAVRLALGATPRQVMWHVIRGGFTMCLTGVVLGLILAGVSGRALKGLLFGVDTHDLATFGLAAAALLLVALVACWLPARRATRVSPSLALRGE